MPTMREDLARWAATPYRDQIIGAARDLGFGGRNLKTLDESEVARLHVAVVLVMNTAEPDESPRGRAINERIDALGL